LNKPETYGFHLIAAGLPEDALGTFIAIHEAGHVALDSLLQNHACLPEDTATTDSHDALKALVAARGCANLQSRFGLEIDPTIIFPRLQESVCDLFGSAATAAELGLPQDDFIQRIADNRAILLHGVITQNIGGEEALEHHAAPLLQAAVRDFSAKNAQDGGLFSSVLDYAVKGLRTDKTLLDFPDRKTTTALVSGTETPTDSTLLTLAPKIKKLQALFDHQRSAMQRAAMRAVQPARGDMPQPGNAASHRHFT
jgi:hypothetical protein